jgi:PKD repeat protein
MEVPAGATGLSFDMSGGSGDADLYVKFGSAPTTSSYDCRPYKSGNTESCPISSAQAGTYHVMVRAYSTLSGVSLTGSYSTSTPNVAPNASFTYSCSDLSCSFNGTGSSDSDGSIASYAWSFGGSGSTANYTFSGSGTYSVTLTVTDNDGATDTQTRAVSVTAPVANTPPVASFTSSCTDLTCNFNASGSSDPSGVIASYSWSFGASGVTASNTFTSAGTYNVTLTVTDDEGATDSQTNSVTVTAPPTSGNVLTNGVARTGLAANTGSYIDFTMDVPAGATDISFAMSGGTGDADLYVRFGAAPTDSTYDCRPYAGGNSESCTGTQTGGTYHVRLKAYSTFSGVSIIGNYTEAGTGVTPIDSTTSNISVGSGAWKRYTLDLPAGYSNLSVTTSGGSGDADLYVRFGAQSSTSSYDCRPYKNGNSETCTFSSPAAGTWHIDLRGYSAASGVTLRVQAD